MVIQNEATSISSIGPQVIRTGAAARVSGRYRSCLGRLILTDQNLLFVADRDGTEIELPLSMMAWIDISPRARQLTLEITMRGAVIHYLRVPSADWVQTLRKAREAALVAPAIGIHYQPVALAS